MQHSDVETEGQNLTSETECRETSLVIWVTTINLIIFKEKFKNFVTTFVLEGDKTCENKNLHPIYLQMLDDDDDDEVGKKNL